MDNWCNTSATDIELPSAPAVGDDAAVAKDEDGEEEATLGGYQPAVSAYLHARLGSSSDADRSVRLCASRQRRLSTCNPHMSIVLFPNYPSIIFGPGEHVIEVS